MDSINELADSCQHPEEGQLTPKVEPLDVDFIKRVFIFKGSIAHSKKRNTSPIHLLTSSHECSHKILMRIEA